MDVRRGEIFYATLTGRGSEEKGLRPVLILQNDIGNKYGPTTIIAPLSSGTKKDIPTHVKTHFNGRLSTILLEQIRVLDKALIGEYIGVLDDEQMQIVDNAIRISLGLEK